MNQNCCRHLRHKSMYIPAVTSGTPEEPETFVNSSPPCWCNCTLTEVGPDDLPVSLERCRESRACFEE